MSRQIEQVKEDRETRRRDALVKALEFELAAVLDMCGITLIGFAVYYDAFECLLVLKADIGGVRKVSFIGSDTVINCVLKAVAMGKGDRLRWGVDRYPKRRT